MSNNSHFGLFVGAFALISIVSVYGAEIGPLLLAPEAQAEEIGTQSAIAETTLSGWEAAPQQLTLPPGLPSMIADMSRARLRPILAKAQIAEGQSTPSQTADDAAKGAVAVLPNAESCPASNPSTRLVPVLATQIDAALSGPAPGLGTGSPCPPAAPHTSLIAGASPNIIPSGPSAPAKTLNAALPTP